MSNLLLSDYLIPEIDIICRDDKALAAAYTKIKGKVREYACSLKLVEEELRIFHMHDAHGNVPNKLSKFIRNLPRNGRSSERWQEEKGEITSIIRRLNRQLSAKLNLLDESIEKKTSIYQAEAPNWMIPLLRTFPRNIPPGVQRKNIKNSDTYLNFPLTERSLIVIDCILSVSKRHSSTSLEDFVKKHRHEVFVEIEKFDRIDSCQALKNLFYECCRECNCGIGRRTSRKLSCENWSPKFKEEWENYEKLAIMGIPSNSQLAKMARHHGRSLEQIKEITLNSGKNALQLGLSYCTPLPENWGIEDLISLEVRTVEFGKIKQPELYNRYVDRYRVREQTRTHKVKHAGSDSESFKIFLGTIRQIAMYNGHFLAVDKFSEVYHLKISDTLKEAKKNKKKQVFSITKLDKQILELEHTFNENVKKRLFLSHPDRLFSETKSVLRFCLYFSILVTLRFTGLRQRNMRNCSIMRDPDDPVDPGGNIGLKKDGTLVFHFTALETKNGKAIHIELNKDQHQRTHGTLIDVMTKYLKLVRPKIIKQYNPTGSEQCFFRINSTSGKISRFGEFDRKSFYGYFLSCSNRYLDFPRMLEEKSLKFNPHFLRGVCCDWLKDSLDFTYDQIAEYIGDAPETVKRNYINRNRIYNPTNSITLKNKELQLLEKNNQNDEELLKDLAARNIFLQEKFDRTENKYFALKGELATRDHAIAERDQVILELQKENLIFRKQSQIKNSENINP